MAGKNVWAAKPEEHDYPAAESYLSLVLRPANAKRVIASLRKQPIASWKAKDILRASNLPMLSADNSHVKADLAKVKAGKRLSPVLLLRGDARTNRPLIVADGYHRICASWILDENTLIPAQMADLPASN